MSKHILLLSEFFVPEVGGSITWLDNVCRRFPGGTVWVVTRIPPGGESASSTRAGMAIRRLRLRRYPFLRPQSLWLYVKWLGVSLWLVRRRRIAVVHAAKVLPEGLIARWLRRLLGTPYLVYAHGEEITIFGTNPAYARVVPRVYREAAAVLANSRFTRDLLVRLGVDERRIVRVSPGVDAELFKPAPRDPRLAARFGLEGKFVLLSVGRLTRRKGHDNVVRALAHIGEQAPDVVYLIASGGEEEASLKALAREMGVTERVRFAGAVAYADLPALYNAADAFVLANRSLPDGDVEGFGIVFLEANACGKPVIGGRSGGTGDAIEDGVTGLRVDAAQPRAIADAILRLVHDPVLRRKMGENGRTRVLEHYTWERVFERIRGVNDAVLRGDATGAVHPRATEG